MAFEYSTIKRTGLRHIAKISGMMIIEIIKNNIE